MKDRLEVIVKGEVTVPASIEHVRDGIDAVAPATGTRTLKAHFEERARREGA